MLRELDEEGEVNQIKQEQNTTLDDTEKPNEPCHIFSAIHNFKSERDCNDVSAEHDSVEGSFTNESLYHFL